MTGPKLNEGATVAGERSGTKATAKYIRSSAYKARVVLDLIRDLDVRRADEVLQFTARGVAADVRKVLASAVANAVHNDGQEVEELYVAACFADEGPTLRRFRPRARGRATRIRKRTCHITVVVARMSDERLEIVQARQERSTAAGRRRAGMSAASRRERVERSRQRAQRIAAGESPDIDEATTEATDTRADEADLELERGEAAEASEASPDEVIAVAEAEIGELEEEAAEGAEAAQPSPEGAVEAPEDGSVPDGYEIKGNANSMKYHVPGGRYYEATIADVYFDTVEHAEAAGYEAPLTDEAVIEEVVEAEQQAEAESKPEADEEN